MSEEAQLLPEVGEAGSNVGESEQDWLPEESKRRARQLPDYQRLSGNCESCQ